MKLARNMREHATRHETMAEERAVEWRRREWGWARIWNKQKWDRTRWNQWRDPLTTGDIRRIRSEEIQVKEQESERSPPGLDDPSDGRQKTEEERQIDDEDDE